MTLERALEIQVPFSSSQKWSTTHRVLKSHRSKMGIIYMQSRKQCTLPVITTMALLQLMHLGTWCAVMYGDVHHVLKCMSCHKAIVVTIGREHCFHDYICIYREREGERERFIYVCICHSKSSISLDLCVLCWSIVSHTIQQFLKIY